MSRWKEMWNPTVVFSSEGGNSEHFFSFCIEHFLPLSQVYATAYGFRAQIPARKYRSLRLPARLAGCRLRILKKQGVWFRLRGYCKYSGIAAGILLAVLLTALGRSVVWNVEYCGVSSADQQELSDRLFDNGIYQGAFVDDAMLRRAETAVMATTQQYAAVALNFTKGKLVVEVNPASKAPPMYLPQDWDIRAAETGVVRSVEVFAGTSDIQPGQLVEKGDVLVRSTWVDQKNMLQPSPCRARIMAYLEKSYTVACERRLVQQQAAGTHTESLAFCFGGRRFWILRGNDLSAEPSQQGVRLLGMALPVTLWRTVSTEICTKEVYLSEEEAKRQCVQTLDALIYSELSEVQILSRDYEYTVLPEQVMCTVHLRAYADIAAERANGV